MRACLTLATVLALATACGDDSDDLGVAAECSATSDCNQDVDPPLVCLTQFKGGYCGLSNCTSNADCPDDAICVTHDDAQNYCFKTCTDKSECNANRGTDNEANCSSNITRVETGTAKACVPPSG
jgi:hypothetical protein